MPEGSGEMKNALEIAMEKASRLGSLSQEEGRQLRIQELASKGEALARKYLAGVPVRDVDIDLEKYGASDQQTIKASLVKGLAEGLDIRTLDTLDRVVYAIQHFTGETAVAENLTALFAQYQVELQKAREENETRLKELKRKELELLGISGSAVEPAIESCQQWIEINDRLTNDYQNRLTAITHQLEQSLLSE